MQTEPQILILEDEYPQLLALRAILSGLGTLHEFSEPVSALEFIKQNRVDAAIIDVHLPLCATDGLDFMKAVREHDRELCIIVRTGDTSTDVADAAIEVRAYRRAIKGKTTTSELQKYTGAAISETRERRRIKSEADNTSEVRTELVRVLGSFEDELSVAECYRGLLYSLRNQLTAIAGTAEVLTMAVNHMHQERIGEYVRKNQILTTRLIEEINGFLDGPYAETLATPRTQDKARINSVIDAIKKGFSNEATWTAQKKYLNAVGILEDMYARVQPLKMITALRHLIEYCALHSPADTTIRLTASCVKDAAEEIEKMAGPKIVFNRQTLREAINYIEVRISVSLDKTIEEIRNAFHESSVDPRVGNLQMVNLALGDAETAIAIQKHQTKHGGIVFSLYLPAAR